jgi:NAD(P)-dependent dehydrogenase (short-subunit alcohol dehydrogenase family)
MEQPSVAIVTGVSSGLGRCFALNRAAHARFHAALVDDGDDMLRYSLEMFRFIATGAPTTSADATWDFTQPVATASMN